MAVVLCRRFNRLPPRGNAFRYTEEAETFIRKTRQCTSRKLSSSATQYLYALKINANIYSAVGVVCVQEYLSCLAM